MTDATSTEQMLSRIAVSNGVSTDAARTLLDAIRAGGGRMAQFSHPELGGMGQWSFGGMLMIGDMFNNGLKAKVDRLCHELADFAATLPPPVMGGGYRWWPDGLGAPSTSGAQNDMRYAFFPSDRRLVISQHGVVTVFDTGEHMISGVSQQQGGTYNLSFSSQFGQIDLSSLRRVPGTGEAPVDPPAPAWMPEPVPAPMAMPEPVSAPAPAWVPVPEPVPVSMAMPEPVSAPAPVPDHAALAVETAAVAAPRTEPLVGHDDIFDKLERLGELAKKGILTEAEFQAKKTELLARL
ncbi:SHOCT domain-containing protein [Ancylobacter sonchi]|uniref:SHOCT domain-containing protein n=1 Tax=Ancylobacter sonchi TaxID=1937790 RepID=UPI001BD27A69|nr:SHOCT domain-containing protein [Ancylobacter sonchi]MBS7532577.1 SHOCT domain-containing protein [Ancylobacter sonchi]